MEANSTGGQGLRRAVVPSDDDDELHVIAACFIDTVQSLLAYLLRQSLHLSLNLS